MSAAHLPDQPARVRPGEELNMAALAVWLRQTLPEWTGGGLEILQFPKGYSNLTYLVRLGERELVLRRPPFGNRVPKAHDMGREYRILRGLEGHYARIPKAIACCESDEVLGAPFYLMERVRGVVLRRDAAEWLAMPEAVAAKLSAAVVDNLAQIHAIDYRAAGLGDLGRPEGYLKRQVEGWMRRYANARTDDIPDLEQAGAWLAAHLPPEHPGALIHNDYKHDNLVLDPAWLPHIRAVLDWEMTTIGDPLSDFGLALAYWVDPDDPAPWLEQRFGPTTAPGTLNREQVIARYAQRSGADVSDIVYHFALGFFKLGGILQQIYYRYRQGLTRDDRFAGLIDAVRACGFMARRAIEKQRVSGLG